MLHRIFVFLLWISVIVSYTSLYQVADTECAVQIRGHHILKDSKGNPFKKPGFYFKLPFLDSLIRWDTRIQHTSLRTMPLITTEDIVLRGDYQLNWRILEPMRYVESMMKTPSDSKSLFLGWLNEYLETNHQQKPLASLVSNTFENLHEDLKTKAKEIGIEIIDCKVIQQTPTSQSKKTILERMKKHQAETIDDTLKAAKVEAAHIDAKAKIEQEKLLSEEKEKADKIKKEAEIEAMQLYTDTYRKNPKFAEAYQRIISEINSLEPENTKVMVVQVNSPLPE